MQAPHLHHQNGQTLWLSPERGIFWEEEKALIVSDLHFGKTGHFRKAGIAVPQNVYKEDLQRLVEMLQFFQPTSLIVVGDMFHSSENLELELFLKWRDNFSHLNIQLVKGNHDILHDQWYSNAGLHTYAETYQRAPFSFTHDITQVVNQPAGLTEEFASAYYTFSGHIHPGIMIYGGGRQSLRFPCFYFGGEYAVLPAFSRFTGTYLIEPKELESVFAIVEKKIVQLQ
jgi:uncharacterized protein